MADKIKISLRFDMSYRNYFLFLNRNTPGKMKEQRKSSKRMEGKPEDRKK